MYNYVQLIKIITSYVSLTYIHIACNCCYYLVTTEFVEHVLVSAFDTPVQCT